MTDLKRAQQLLDRFNEAFVGFDPFQDILKGGDQNFPKYNIAKVDDNAFFIELGLAGYSQDEITVTVERDILRIRGERPAGAGANYVHQGLTAQPFSVSFALGNNLKVSGADMTNGILLINLSRVVPEEDKPTEIKIGGGNIIA